MKTTRSYSHSSSRELAIAASTGAVLLTSLSACTPDKPLSTNEAFKTMTPDATKLNSQKQRAVDFIGGGENAKFIGDQMASFSVKVPESTDGSVPDSIVSGTIFEVKSNLPENLPLTLALYVPEVGDKQPIPVVISHLTADPATLGEGPVPDENNIPVTRYGVAAMPLDEQYFSQIVNGGLTLTPGSFDKYLKTNEQGDIVPLYSVWFKDINPNNIASFMQELSNEKDISKVQQKIIEHIYGITFNNFDTGHSTTLRLEEDRNEMADFLVNVFFGPNMVAHAAPANTATVESTATTPPPAINESVKAAVGEAEYGEIQTGAVKGKDFDGTVEASSIKATNYNDANFSYVVTGEATDANGKKFAVIWNEADNYWYKNENINPNLESTNRTNFDKQLPGMVDNNDLYRMLLTQMDTTFPEDTETAMFWMMPRSASLPMNEFFYTLDMSRADNSNDNVTNYNSQGVDLPDYRDIQYGGFTKGKEPYRALAIIDGVSPAWTDKQGNKIDGKEISVIPVLVQNSDGKGMIWFIGMDAVQREDLLTGPDSVANGFGIQNLLIQHMKRLNLVIPPADEADWDNYEKNDGYNGGIHFRGTINFTDDAIIAMQDKPGVFNNLLPADMQQSLDEALTEIKDKKGGLGWHAVPFEGALPQSVIDYLSSHIFESYFDSNPWSQ